LSEIGDDVGSVVGGRVLDFVEELFGAGGAVEKAAGAGNFGEDGGAVGADLGDGEAEAVEVGDVFEAGVGEVAAGELACAFEKMPDDSSLPQEVPVVERPAELVDERSEEKGGIGDAAGEDDIGITLEGFENRRDAKVRVGREPCVSGRKRTFGSFDDIEAGLEDFKNVVARDGCNPEAGKTELLRNIASFCGCGLGVCGTHVADDANVPIGTDGQNGSHTFFEQRVVPGSGIEEASFLRDGDGSFGETLEDEIRDVASFGELDCGVDSVA